ncbi:MAG: radical SAM peptide maturase [Bacteroidetes bacterium]|nr:MAG: radical SAM peptide maturase [Bacteroidota bacterium]
MKNAVFFTSGKGNRYLYSPYRNQFRLCHPLIPYLFSLKQKGTDLRKWHSGLLKKGSVTVQGVGSFPASEATYQLEKYNYLKRNGFLKPARTINIEGRLKVSDIRKNISTVKQIIFEVTEDCNLSCTYCTYSKFYINKERKKSYLSYDVARHTLEELISRRPSGKDNHLIISFYGGEPLKNFVFIKSVVDYTSALPPDQITFTYSLSTNGLLLKRYIDYMVKHAFELSVSLDGDEVANSFRLMKNNKPSFDVVMKNLEWVRSRYPDYFENRISFLTVLHNRNSFKTVFEFFQNRFGKIPQMSDVNPINLNPLHEREFRERLQSRPVTVLEEKEAIKKMENRHPKVKEMVRITEYYSGFVFRNYLEMISSKRGKNLTKKFIPTATCTPFSIRVYFSADGTVLPCEHISPLHGIGSYTDARLDADPVAITWMYNNYYDKISRFCRKCYFIDNCQECLFNTAVETDHPACMYYTRETGFRDYLKKHYSNIENDYGFFRKSAQTMFNEG